MTPDPMRRHERPLWLVPFYFLAVMGPYLYHAFQSRS